MGAVYQSLDSFDVWQGADVGDSATESFWIVVRDVANRSLNTWGPMRNKALAIQRGMELRAAYAFDYNTFYVNRIPHRIGGWFIATTPIYHPRAGVR